MSEPVTQSQFFEWTRILDEKMLEYHRRDSAHIEEVKTEVRLFTMAMAPQVATHAEKLKNHEKMLDDHADDIKDVTKKSAFVSGVGAILAIAVGLLPLPWKH